MSLTLNGMKIDFDSIKPVIFTKILEHVLGKANMAGGLESFVDVESLAMHIINKAAILSKIRYWVFFTMVTEFMVKNPSVSTRTLTVFSTRLREDLAKIQSTTGLLSMLLSPEDSQKLTDSMLGEIIYLHVFMKKPVSSALFYAGGIDEFGPVTLQGIIRDNISREEEKRKKAAEAAAELASRTELLGDPSDISRGNMEENAKKMPSTIDLGVIRKPTTPMQLAAILYASASKGLFKVDGNPLCDNKIRRAAADACYRNKWDSVAEIHGLKTFLYREIELTASKGTGIHTVDTSAASASLGASSGQALPDSTVPLDELAKQFIHNIRLETEASTPGDAECIVCMEDLPISGMDLLHGGIHPGTYLCRTCGPRVHSELGGKCPMCRGSL